jgi:hypothetical protein
MRRYPLVIGIGCLLSHAALAADAPAMSLFFTPQETQAIEALLAPPPAPPPPADNGVGDLHLGAVLYYGPRDWVVWLQGERWTPQTNRGGLHVVDVTPAGHVRLSLAAASGSPPREITLKPYQTYQSESGAVVEGSLSAAPPSISR